jgi:hypothetical protein
VIVALFILIGFAAAFVGMLVDVDRLRRHVDHEEQLDELWDDGAEAAAS